MIDYDSLNSLLRLSKCVPDKSALLCFNLPWSSLVEGDEQLDWSKSKHMYHIGVLNIFLACYMHNSLPLELIQALVALF